MKKTYIVPVTDIALELSGRILGDFPQAGSYDHVIPGVPALRDIPQWY
jgi:hypothetical protein